MTEPTAELDARFGDPEASPTPWSDVRRVIEEAELFWISTVRPDGRPHVTPLPAVWRDDTLYFCTGAEEQKGVNLARNPQCALTTGTNLWKTGLDVVVEGGRKSCATKTCCESSPPCGRRSTTATGTSKS